MCQKAERQFYETIILSLAVLMGIQMVLGGVLTCYVFWLESAAGIPILLYYLRRRRVLGKDFPICRKYTVMAVALQAATGYILGRVSFMLTVPETDYFYAAVLLEQGYRGGVLWWQIKFTKKYHLKEKMLTVGVLSGNILLSAIMWYVRVR